MRRPRIPVGLLLAAVVLIVTGGPGAAAAEEKAMSDVETGAETLLIVQGKLREGAEETYRRYTEGTGPLIVEYGGRVERVGAGLASDVTTDAWPINAVLAFPSRAAAEGFLKDERYLRLKEQFRDRAYETLHLTLVASRPPRFRSPRQVAEEAFEDFRHGLATGEWDGFLGRLSEDFTFRFPMGRFQGTHTGVEAAREFFTYVSTAFPGGLTIDEVEAVTAEGERVVFEFRDHGELRGQPYRNLVAISLDVCGEQICGYREYFGLVGPPPSQ